MKKIRDIKRELKAKGYELLPGRGKGSHCIFKNFQTYHTTLSLEKIIKMPNLINSNSANENRTNSRLNSSGFHRFPPSVTDYPESYCCVL